MLRNIMKKNILFILYLFLLTSCAVGELEIEDNRKIDRETKVYHEESK